MLHENSRPLDSVSPKNVFFTSLISGAMAEMVCDVTFFPLDTIKTRLQSQHGFMQSGGFKKLYKGIGPFMMGSAPAASVFFIFYEGIKETLQPHIPQKYHAFVHMTAVSSAELVACLIRVPAEVVKQRKQAMLIETARLKIGTLYRGYGSTVLRDLPFGLIQMPLWEYFKLCWKQQVQRDCTPFEGGICGSISVAISAAITTPLDVAKTRIMLSDTAADKAEVRISVMLREVYRLYGFKGLFVGFTPRLMSYTIGGFMFFGVYDQAKEICTLAFS